jgi:hypothetical protein
VPRIGFKTARGLVNTAFMLACLGAALFAPSYFFFPFLATYTVVGLLRSVGAGLLDRLPERDPLLDEDEEEADEASAEVRALDYGEVAPTRLRREIPHDESSEEH